MAVELKLPLLGDVMQEGTVAEWLKPDGASVSQGEPVYRLETDKVTFEVEAPAAGVLRHVVQAGSTVEVGTLVGRLVEDVDSDAEPLLAQVEAPAAEAVAEPAVGRVEAPAAEVAEARPAGVRATPMARRLARERGIDLRQAADGGRLIRARDLDRIAASADDGTRAADGTKVEGGSPLSGRRKVIAERMHASLQQMAQLTISLEVDFTRAAELRAQLKELWPAEQQPTITDFVIRAAAIALRTHPALNATLENDRLTHHEEVNIGLAVDADDGLIVPVIRGADKLPVRELTSSTRYLAASARSNHLHLDQLLGGTFTVTSMGQVGVDFFTPIVNPPQVAILGVGRVFTKLVLQDGQVQERAAMYLNLSFDHRAVDGAPAARFLTEVKRLLELPAALLA